MRRARAGKRKGAAASAAALKSSDETKRMRFPERLWRDAFAADVVGGGGVSIWALIFNIESCQSGRVPFGAAPFNCIDVASLRAAELPH